MYGKALFFILLVVLGAVLPYLLADDRWLADTESFFEGRFKSATTETDETKSAERGLAPDDGLLPPDANSFGTDTFATVPVTTAPVLPPVSNLDASAATATGDPASALPGRALEAPYLVGPPGLPIENLLSFEVTHQWVRENWSRVTTQIADLELQGWRVPVVLEDGYNLVGSVTYYFDRQRRVQRILLHGYTESPLAILNLAISRYGMRRLPTAIPGELFVARVGNQTAGVLYGRYAPVLKAGEPKRCEVMLELNRIGSVYGVGTELKKVLLEAREADRLLKPIPTSPVTSPPQPKT